MTHGFASNTSVISYVRDTLYKKPISNASIFGDQKLRWAPLAIRINSYQRQVALSSRRNFDTYQRRFVVITVSFMSDQSVGTVAICYISETAFGY
jgi:hypothetical protein